MERCIGLMAGVVLAGCGAPMERAGAGGGTGAAMTGGGGTCCLNGSFYDCPTQAAFDQCAGSDPGACHAACSASDFTCHTQCDQAAASATHDPSACVRGASRDHECTSSSSGVCLGTKGAACSYSSQCSSGNCTDGYCYARSNGNPCGYSSQCDSNNCTNSCCSGNAKGNACSYSSQCTSNNCTGGKCQ